VQEPLNEKDIEELIAEFLEVESKVCISLIEFNLSVIFVSLCVCVSCVCMYTCD
jgi:hypothetical protein